MGVFWELMFSERVRIGIICDRIRGFGCGLSILNSKVETLLRCCIKYPVYYLFMVAEW